MIIKGTDTINEALDVQIKLLEELLDSLGPIDVNSTVENALIIALVIDKLGKLKDEMYTIKDLAYFMYIRSGATNE